MTPVCDFILPMRVMYLILPLERIMSSARCRRSLCGWWIQLSGSMAYLRMMLMLKALSVMIERVGLHLLVSSASVIAAISDRMIMCGSGYDLISMYVVVCVVRFTINAPSVELPVTWDPSV